MQTFNLNSLWRQFSMTGNETLSLSAYNGGIALVMFRKGGENKKPAVKFTLSRAVQLAIADRLEKLLSDGPTRVPVVQQSFNKDSRTYEIATQFVFVKDDHKCYSVEVSNKYIPNPVKFSLRCASTFSFGSEPLSDEMKSYYALQEFIDILRNALTASYLSRYGVENINHRGGNNNNGSRNNNFQRRNDNVNNSRDPFSGMSAEEDNVFGA